MDGTDTPGELPQVETEKTLFPQAHIFLLREDISDRGLVTGIGLLSVRVLWLRNRILWSQDSFK